MKVSVLPSMGADLVHPADGYAGRTRRPPPSLTSVIALCPLSAIKAKDQHDRFPRLKRQHLRVHRAMAEGVLHLTYSEDKCCPQLETLCNNFKPSEFMQTHANIVYEG